MSDSIAAVQAEKHKRNGIGIDILWFIIVFVGCLFLTSLIPLPPNDFWWHLKIGETIYTQHIIPTTNIYAWTLPADQPFFYGSWLAELLFYFFYRIGSLSLVIFIRTILFGLTLWLAGVEAHRQSKSWRISALVIALLALMSINNLIVRTQNWAWLPFILTYILLKRYTAGIIRWQWLFLCPLIMIFWVNVHGSFILGIIIPGAFLAGEIIQKLLRQKDVLNWFHIIIIGCVLVLSGLAILVNPHFTGIVNYTVKLLTDPSSQRLIEEWQSPTPQGIANITFYVSILIFLVLIAISKYRLRATEIILTIGFLWLAWSGQRYVIWYGLITLPILAKLISELSIKTTVFSPQKNWLNLGIAIILFVPVIAVQPWFVERLPLPQTYWQQVLRSSSAGPLLDIATPVSVTDYLTSHPGGKLYNEMGYGSYLIWALPGQGVFADPRVELYPYDQWMDYIDISNGRNYDALLKKYGADRILLDKKLQPDLEMMLSEDPSWSLEYDDQYAQLWEKVKSP